MKLVNNKKVGLISFSAGETSARMLKWLLDNKSDEYHFHILFANTGRENNETLRFAKECEEHFNCEVVWLEANFRPSYPGEKLSVDQANCHKVVNYYTATRNEDWRHRNNTPYEEMVKTYGLANISSKFSTRELKLRPMTSYMRSLGYNKGDYETFIGLRIDEIDRIAKDRIELKIRYPFIEWLEQSKQHINFWWKLQPFRLKLKGWEGNCVTCYKKYVVKLAKIFKEDPWKFEFDKYLEKVYGYFVTDSRKAELKKKGKKAKLPIKLYRENNSVEDIAKKSLEVTNVHDDSKDFNYQHQMFEGESCEVFSGCGDLT